MPFISCILLSHNKPDNVGEAINSLLAQTFSDWEAIVFDSGVLHDQGFFSGLPAMKDPRFRLIRSWETEELRQTKTVASWCFNECFRKKMLNGSFVVYLCDDDMFYPNAFQTFYDYAQSNPEAKAMYASIDMTAVPPSGEKVTYHEMIAEEMKGSCCGGGPLDCRVDYLQLCHKAELFDLFPDEDFWPEDREVIRHADGIFLEKIGSRVPIYPIATKIGENRKVPLSLNTGGDRLEFLVEIHRRDKEIRRLAQMVTDLHRLLADKQHELAEADYERIGLRINHAECLRYRVADKVNSAIKRIPIVHRVGKKLVRTGWRLLKRSAKQKRIKPNEPEA
jgi:glycosyltransferase involved in cell wall biosynthesis